MIIGIISDVHSNNYVLDSLFAKEYHVDIWLSAGDNVGLFPNINETLEILHNKNVISVIGDHEYCILGEQPLTHSFSGNESIQKQKLLIQPRNLELLKKIKMQEIITIDETKICLTHTLSLSSLDFENSNKYRFDWNLLENKFDEFDVVFFGHSHLPTVYYGKRVIFINPGSLGFPIGKWAKNTYCLFDTKNKTFSIKNIEYDVSKMIYDISAKGFNEKYIEYLKNNYIWSST